MTGTYLSFDGMCWPNPNDPAEVEWTLRYGNPTPEQLRLAASFIAAYKQLVSDPQRVRNGKVAGIRRATDEARRALKRELDEMAVEAADHDE